MDELDDIIDKINSFYNDISINLKEKTIQMDNIHNTERGFLGENYDLLEPFISYLLEVLDVYEELSSELKSLTKKYSKNIQITNLSKIQRLRLDELYDIIIPLYGKYTLTQDTLINNASLELSKKNEQFRQEELEGKFDYTPENIKKVENSYLEIRNRTNNATDEQLEIFETEFEKLVSNLLNLEWYRGIINNNRFENKELWDKYVKTYLSFYIIDWEKYFLYYDDIITALFEFNYMYSIWKVLNEISKLKVFTDNRYVLRRIKNIIENKRPDYNNPFVIYEDKDVLEKDLDTTELKNLGHYINYSKNKYGNPIRYEGGAKATLADFISKDKKNDNIWFHQISTATNKELASLTKFHLNNLIKGKSPVRGLTDTSFILITMSLMLHQIVRKQGERRTPFNTTKKETIVIQMSKLKTIHLNPRKYFLEKLEKITQYVENLQETGFDDNTIKLSWQYNLLQVLEELMKPFGDEKWFFKCIYLLFLIRVFKYLDAYSFRVEGLINSIIILVVNEISKSLSENKIKISKFDKTEYNYIKSIVPFLGIFTLKKEGKFNCYYKVLQKLLRHNKKKLNLDNKALQKIYRKYREKYDGGMTLDVFYHEFEKYNKKGNQIYFIKDLLDTETKKHQFRIGDIIIGRTQEDNTKHCYMVVWNKAKIKASCRKIPKKYYTWFLDVEAEQVPYDMEINKFWDSNLEPPENIFKKHIPVVWGNKLNDHRKRNIIPFNHMVNIFDLLDKIVKFTKNHTIKKYNKETKKTEKVEEYSTIFITTYNGDAYDIILMLEQLLLENNVEFKLKNILVHNSKIINMEFIYKDRRFNITDVMKITGVGSLKNALKDFKCKNRKKELSFGYEEIKQMDLMDKPKWDELILYLEPDVLGLEEYFYKVQKTVNDIIDKLRILNPEDKNKPFKVTLHQFYSCSHMSMYLYFLLAQKHKYSDKILRPKGNNKKAVNNAMNGARVYINPKYKKFLSKLDNDEDKTMKLIFNQKVNIYKNSVDYLSGDKDETFEISLKDCLVKYLEDLLYKHKSDDYGDTRIPFYNPFPNMTDDEVWDGFKEYLLELDFNSLYPFVMVDNEFPLGKMSKLDINDRKSKMREFEKNIFGKKMYILYCRKIKPPTDISFPFLPTKNKKGGLIYSLQKRSHQYITSVDYEKTLALNLGYKFEINTVYYWEQKGYIFKEYIEVLYDIRKKAGSNKALSNMCKLMMNGLYGKFLQKDKCEATKIVNIKNIENYRSRSGKTLFELLKAKKVKYAHTSKDSEYIIFNIIDKKRFKDPFASKPRQIGVFVLAYARWKLNEVFVRTGSYTLEGIKQILYGDTDSSHIHINFINENLKEIIDASKLGYLKTEGNEEDDKTITDNKIIAAIFYDLKKYMEILLIRERNKETNLCRYFVNVKMRWAGADRKDLCIQTFMDSVRKYKTELIYRPFIRQVMITPMGVYTKEDWKSFTQINHEETLTNEYIGDIDIYKEKDYKEELEFYEEFREIMGDEYKQTLKYGIEILTLMLSKCNTQ